jgi:hypothetical protein
MWRGDACVALGGGARRSWEPDEGDASVPSHHFHHSRPYGYEAASEGTSRTTSPCKAGEGLCGEGTLVVARVAGSPFDTQNEVI